jgi:hypothetical protein
LRIKKHIVLSLAIGDAVKITLGPLPLVAVLAVAAASLSLVSAAVEKTFYVRPLDYSASPLLKRTGGSLEAMIAEDSLRSGIPVEDQIEIQIPE